MNSNRHRRISEVFLAARGLAEAEQSRLLERECATDPDLRREVESLLTSERQSSRFLAINDESALPSLPSLPSSDTFPAAAVLIGRRLGPYHLLRVLASGGMGTVYEAVQDHPERRVAVKVLRRGLLAPSARRRFEYESEVLARLRHPGIAQVLFAGTWEDPDQPGEALPYFVLELVPDAKPLTVWCRERELELAARIELFMQVCDAVHHGHQKGVIHRDLKPANLLVDDQGRPKVIDFGIARATDADLALTTQHTQAGELLGTLQYMSPEQCGDAPDDLDVRTDVYALGVILYELLTGALPYDVSSAPLARALELVRTAAPVRPSHVDRELRGDLETIVLKALAKEKTERYASAADLARDLGHFRRHEPIEARPPTTLYTVRKFVRRNRVLVTAGVLTVAGLAAGLVVATDALGKAKVALAREKTALASEEKETRKAKREAGIAEATIEFLNTDLLQAAQPEQRGRDTPIGALLDEAVAKLPARFPDEPLIAARLHRTMGETYDELGDYASARKQYEAALARFDAAGTFDDDAQRDRALVQVHHCRLLRHEGRYEEQLRIAHELRSEIERLLGPRAEEVAVLLHAIDEAQEGLSQYEAAEATCRELVQLREDGWGPNHARTGSALSALARCLSLQLKCRDAEPLMKRALEIHCNQSGPDGIDALTCQNNLGTLYWRWGKYEDARSCFEDLLPRMEKKLTPEHSLAMLAKSSLAASLQRLNKLEDAVALFADVVPRMRKAAGDGRPSPDLITAELNWGASLAALKHLDESRERLLETIADAKVSLPEDHFLRLQAMTALAIIDQWQQRFQDAKVVWEEVLAIYQRSATLPAQERWRFSIRYAAGTLIPLGEYETAEETLREAFAELREIDGEQSPLRWEAALALSRLFAATQHPELASEWKATAERCRPPDPAK